MDVMLPDPRPIKAYMKRHGLSQQEFARLVGSSQAAVSQWLDGRTPMSARRAKDIVDRTGGAIKITRLLPRLFQRAA